MKKIFKVNLLYECRHLTDIDQGVLNSFKGWYVI